MKWLLHSVFADNMFVRISVVVLLVFCTNTSEAQNSSVCSSSCGDIHNINFPFRLKSDPGNCGDSRFELDCQNNRTVITFDSRKYNVLEINYDEFLIRAIDPGLEHKNSNCTSSPNYHTTSYPFSSTFDFGISIIPIIYVNCSATANSSRYVETTFCGSQSQSHTYVAVGEGMLISDLVASCRLEMVGWVSARGLSGDNTSLSSIEGALSYGFELSWKRTFLCRECEASQGNCFAVGDRYTCSHRCYDDTGFDLPLPCKSKFTMLNSFIPPCRTALPLGRGNSGHSFASLGCTFNYILVLFSISQDRYTYIYIYIHDFFFKVNGGCKCTPLTSMCPPL